MFSGYLNISGQMASSIGEHYHYWLISVALAEFVQEYLKADTGRA